MLCIYFVYCMYIPMIYPLYCSDIVPKGRAASVLLGTVLGANHSRYGSPLHPGVAATRSHLAFVVLDLIAPEVFRYTWYTEYTMFITSIYIDLRCIYHVTVYELNKKVRAVSKDRKSLLFSVPQVVDPSCEILHCQNWEDPREVSVWGCQTSVGN